MYVVRSLTVLSLAAVVALSGSSTDAAQKGKKNTHQVRGVVLKVHHNKKTAGEGYILVRVGGKKQGVSAKEEKIHISPSTVFVKHSGKKKQGQQTASFADVHKGEHVVVTLHNGKGHRAERVVIGQRQKNKAVAAR